MKPVFPFIVILYMKRKVMDMSTNNQIEQNCFICKKHIGNIIVPGGAIYEDELVYVDMSTGIVKKHTWVM